MTGLALLKSGRLGRRLVGVGMRNRTHLGHEKRQHSQGCDAKFDAMRPFEQGRPLTHERANASTVDLNRQKSCASNPQKHGPRAMRVTTDAALVRNCFTQYGARPLRGCSLALKPSPAN